MDRDKVVFLAFRNDMPTVKNMEMLACKVCSNKAFSVTYQGHFPTVRCTACGRDLGLVGWVDPNTVTE